MGMLWSFILPLVMLTVYTFIFSVVFKAKWGHQEGSRFEFALILFCGLIAYNIFSECVLRAPNLILNNVTYVKKVVFPLEILPWSTLAASLFFAMANLIVLLVFNLLVTGELKWTVILYPFVLLPLLLSTLGISWLLASIGVFVRDISHLIGVLMSILLFLSPIFYPVESVPPNFQRVLALNPLSFVIESSREVVLWGRLPNFEQYLMYFIASCAVAWLGFFWFQKTKKGFADVV